jgi:hypothetical protein
VSSIKSRLIVFLTLGLAATRPALAQTPADWYWDTNGATAGAGSTPSGTWGSDNYWNSDPTGGAGTFQTGFNSTDNAVIVAGPGATSGDQAFTVTLGGPQSVAGLSFQSAGDVTIAPQNPIDTNTAVSIGSGGLSIPQVAYGTTAQGNVTISSVATPTADATWSVDNGWLNLAGKFFTNQPYTTTLAGPGMTYVTSMNNGSAFGGSGNNLQLVVNNSAVSFANDGYYSPGAGVLSIPGGSYTVVPYITLDGGRLSYVYAGQILAQSTQYLTIGSGGGVLDFAQPVEWRDSPVNGTSATVFRLTDCP